MGSTAVNIVTFVADRVWICSHGSPVSSWNPNTCTSGWLGTLTRPNVRVNNVCASRPVTRQGSLQHYPATGISGGGRWTDGGTEVFLLIFNSFNTHWALYRSNQIDFNSVAPGMMHVFWGGKEHPSLQAVFKQTSLVFIFKKNVLRCVSAYNSCTPLA